MSPELAVLGNLIVDDVVSEDGTTRLGQPGGAALYAALGARLWGIDVGLASVVGADYPDSVLNLLQESGVDLAGLRRVAGPGLRTWLLHEGRRRQVVHHLDAPPHDAMSPRPSELPSQWRPAAVHLAPMPLATQKLWLTALDGTGALVSLDPYELVDEQTLPGCRATFRRADVLLLSEDELLLQGALDEPRACLPRLVDPTDADRPRFVILKRGARGGLALDSAAGTFLEWPARSAAVVDTTGAGDAFAGGLLAGLLRSQPLAAALRQATVSASFALEAHGASGLLRAGPEDARKRYSEWFAGGRVA